MPIFSVQRNGKAKNTIDPAALAAIVRRLAPTRAVIERVGARPGQGTASMFSFGRSVGMIEGVLAALNIPVSYAIPLTWQKAHKVPKGKDGSRLRASELMPRYAELWRLKKHDGRSDAALIALYALTHGGAE